MLYSRRKKLEERKLKEAAGESFWTREVPGDVRVRTIRATELISKRFESRGSYRLFTADEMYAAAHTFLVHDLGVEWLQGMTVPESDFKSHIRNARDDEFPDVLEALCAAVKYYSRELYWTGEEPPLDEFQQTLNQILDDARISYQVEDGMVVDFESKHVFVEVTAPALRLLSGKKWSKVEASYQGALRKIASGEFASAIIDAGTALQDALRECGCTGRDLKALKNSARSSILRGHDGKFLDGVEKLIEWASATRANKGAAHTHVAPTKNDAWFAVNAIGLLILYISKVK